MALCTRCGQRTADGVEFCSICGSHSGTDGPAEAAAPEAMTSNANYLRPFAAEEQAYPALSDRGPLTPSAARSSAGYSSASGYLPEYMPPPYGPAAWRDPHDDYLPAPEQTPAPDQAYRLRGPFTPLGAPDAVLAGDSSVAAASEPGRAEPGPPSSYPARDWREYADPSRSGGLPEADELWAYGEPQPLPASAFQTGGQAQPLPAYLPPQNEEKPASAPDHSDQAHTATFPAVRPGTGIPRPQGGRWISAGVAAGVVVS
jgi:hypothetical protein